MYGSFRTSPRSLAVIFRGNADDPIIDTRRVRSAYVGTFHSLRRIQVKSKDMKAGQSRAHRYARV